MPGSYNVNRVLIVGEGAVKRFQLTAFRPGLVSPLDGDVLRSVLQLIADKQLPNGHAANVQHGLKAEVRLHQNANDVVLLSAGNDAAARAGAALVAQTKHGRAASVVALEHALARLGVPDGLDDLLVAQRGLEVVDVRVHPAPGLAHDGPAVVRVHGLVVLLELAGEGEAVIRQGLVHGAAAQRVCECDGLMKNVSERLPGTLSFF